jgi:hypothetical protein
MKVGDMVKVEKCSDSPLICACFFCYHKSNRIGLVIGEERNNPPFRWVVQFDCGEWELRDTDGEVISESW